MNFLKTLWKNCVLFIKRLQKKHKLCGKITEKQTLTQSKDHKKVYIFIIIQVIFFASKHSFFFFFFGWVSKRVLF